MSRFTILLAGELRPTDRLRRQVAGSRVIAADAGMAHAAALDVVPELWVGDFDSTSARLAARHGDVPRHTYPAAKDATDGELAVAAALDRGASSLVLAGGLGGQADHALAHVMLLPRLGRAGVAAMMSSGDEEAWPLLPGEAGLDLAAGSRLSVVALSDLAGLSLSGVRWPLERRDVPIGSTLTLSNEVVGPVRLSLVSGFGVVLAYPASGGGEG